MTVAKEVWLAGKGPSLDTYNWDKANEYRFAINEAAFFVPNCLGVFAIDIPVLQRLQKELDPRVIVFRRDIHKKYIFPKSFLWTLGVHVDYAHSTAVVAIQLLHLLGAETIHFIGFDSVKGIYSYADSIINNKFKGCNRDNFYSINLRLRDTLETLGIKAVWEHE